MPDEKAGKMVRVQFPKNSDAEQIVDSIQRVQDEWAKKYPERAHSLYPNVYDKDGNRINPKTE